MEKKVCFSSIFYILS